MDLTSTDWEAIRSIASVISAASAITAAGVSMAVWRKARRADLTGQITAGDRQLRKHTDKAISEVRNTVSTLDDRMSAIEDSLARISQDQDRYLQARDLGPIHEKINGVALEVAGNTAATRGMREQLAIIHELLIRGVRP